VPRSHPSLLVDEELARAVRQESAAAVRYWWGVSAGVVWRWRKALGVTKINNAGSQRLVRAAAEKGAATLRGVPLTPEQVERRRRTALELDLGRHLITGYHGPRWTEQETALLGRLSDAEVAARRGSFPRGGHPGAGTPTPGPALILCARCAGGMACATIFRTLFEGRRHSSQAWWRRPLPRTPAPLKPSVVAPAPSPARRRHSRTVAPATSLRPARPRGSVTFSIMNRRGRQHPAGTSVGAGVTATE
jgi:hypothetical protein